MDSEMKPKVPLLPVDLLAKSAIILLVAELWPLHIKIYRLKPEWEHLDRAGEVKEHLVTHRIERLC